MWLTMTMMEINTNKLFFIEKIAKPAEPVNGQDERRIEVLPKSWTKVMRQSHFEFCIGQDLTHSIFL